MDKMENGHTVTHKDRAADDVGGRFHRFSTDRGFRQKIFIWLSLCWSFIVLGWVMSQLGPSLLDLQEITQTTLEGASLFVTSTFIGYLAGAIISGAIFERINAFLILVSGLLLLGVSSGVIPFCRIYELMAFMHIVKGLGAGILDSAGNSLLMLKFRKEKSARSYLQTLHFTFAIGGILSPLATAPFLLPTTNELSGNVSYTNSTVTSPTLAAYNYPLSTLTISPRSLSNGSISDSTYEEATRTQPSVPDTTPNVPVHAVRESNLYQAYLLSTCLCILAALPFSYMVCKYQPEVETEDGNQEDGDEVTRVLPLKFKVLVLILMCLFIGTDNGMEDTYFGFFTAFTVKKLYWSKKKGSYAASVYWAAYAFGRFAAIFIVPHFRPSTLLRIYINLLVIAGIGMLLSTQYNLFTGIWIFAPMIGFSISVFFPSIFSLMEEDFISVTGRVASLLMFSASLGSMINPIIIGYLMDNISPTWFVYITLGQTVVLFLLTWFLTYLSKKANNFSVQKEPENDVYMVTKF